jgi:formylglycine-generating enzyme required for sulfatase activity
MSVRSELPWWQTSLIATAVVVALAVVAWFAPWPFNGLAVLGALVYMFLTLRNPDLWLRWLARGCVTAATASAVLPDFAGWQEWEGGFVEITRDGAMGYAFLAAGVVFATLDVWRDRGVVAAQLKDGDDEPVRDEPKDPLEDDIRTYFTSAVAVHTKISLAGFKTKIRARIRLEDLHVPLRAFLDRDTRGGDAALNAKEALERVAERGMGRELPLSEAFGFAQRHGDRRGLVLLGDPGSGKTTHLKRILLKIAHDGAASLGLPEGMVPVFLPLRRLADLDRGLDAFIEQELADPHLVAPEQFGTRLRQRGRVLYLLDGLDEVRDASDRARVRDWIDRALEVSPDSTFVVTCRYAGYPDARLSAEFLELHLQPLTDPQVEEFVRRWFSIVETHLVEDDQREHALRRAIERSAKLIADLRQPALQASMRVAELTHNPLLLTTICLVHHDCGKLPERRIELYEECVSVLLERWNEAKALPVRIPAGDAREVLQHLAHWLHGEDDRTLATADELESPVQEGLWRTELSVEPDQFLRSIRDESGLLTGWGVDQYGFMHLGFQEYLAAREIRFREILEPGPFAQLAGRFGESWWQEVILLMLAQKDPPLFECFIGELLQRPEFPEWASSQMMGLCMREAAGVTARPFVTLLRGSADASGADELGRRQLAAAQVLARSMPKTLEGLEALLEGHSAEPVRAWWHKRKEHERRGGARILAQRGGVELVRIPGGRFSMGEDGEAHEVELASFYLARTPVTNGQYAEYLEVNPEVAKPPYWGHWQFNQPQQPVAGVSWPEATAYCEWAGLSLPTEAQWEFACRAGTTSNYYSGDGEEDLARVGWYRGNSGDRLHAVGELEPNGFGLYDMHGNAWEWCRDAWGDYTTRPRTGDGLRHETVGDLARVVRGGNWDRDARSARSAYRSFDLAVPPRFCNAGFRPAQGIA